MGMMKLVPLLLAVLTLAPPSLADDADQAPAADTQKQDLASMDIQKLMDIKISTVSKFSEKLSDAPGVVFVVTHDELRRFSGLTLSEILDRVPGLALSVASFTDRSIVAARGEQTKINGGHVLILINGRPTREILEGGLIGDLLESFPVNALERIEVIEGPGSVLYGTNAFSAVINLITQPAESNQFVATALGGAEEAAATSGDVMIKSGDFSLLAAAQFHQKPVWTTPYNSAFLGPQIAVIPNRGEGAYLGMNYKGFSFSSVLTDWSTDYTEGAAGVGRWRRGFADLGYKLKPSDHWDMSFNATYTRATLDAKDSIPFITRVSNDALFEWTNVVSVTDKARVTFGALYNGIKGKEIFFATDPPDPISQGSRPGGSFYGQLDYSLLDNLKLIGGFQFNKTGQIPSGVVPRFGVIWNPAPHFSLKALYSEAYRAPSINETDIHYIPPPDIGGPSLIGNPNLLPEEVATVDVRLGYEGDRVEAGIGYFHSHLTNDIEEVNATTNGMYENVGQITFQGVQLDGKWYVRKDFFFTGSAIYQTNDVGQSATPIAPFGFKAGASYESTPGLTFGIFEVYQGPVAGYSNSLNPHPGAYNLLNGHLRYDLTKYLPVGSRTNVAFVAHADNLTDQAIWLPDWKDRPGDSTFWNRGRTVYFGVEVSFKKE